MMTERRPLGTTDIQISPIGLGCWQFSEGKGLIGGFWEALPREEVRDIVQVSMDEGINWFDTAEAYGRGASERGLSRALLELGVEPGGVVVATKWFPFMRTARSLRRTIGDRQRNLSPYAIDLHQVHSPFSLASVKSQMNTMADLVEGGAMRTVGVSNFPEGMMRRAHAALGARGHPLVSNQVHYSLLRRNIERNGVMEAAKELGITVIAYSPLAQGILSGKYHDDPESIQKSSGPRKRMPAFKTKGLEKSRPLVATLREIGERHNATPAQVALNWLCNFHGDTVVAIPGARNVEQARWNATALDFVLNGEELERIDRVSWSVA
jgi:aryl-alcohol dehydrogenase-like predicted oxidoreductase